MCTTPIGGRLSVSQCQLRPNSSTPFLLEGKTHEPTAGKKAGRPKGATSQTVKKSIFNSSGKKKTRTHTQNKRVEEFLFLVVFFFFCWEIFVPFFSSSSWRLDVRSFVTLRLSPSFARVRDMPGRKCQAFRFLFYFIYFFVHSLPFVTFLSSWFLFSCFYFFETRKSIRFLIYSNASPI